jgi:putative DNA primase/helicase
MQLALLRFVTLGLFAPLEVIMVDDDKGAAIRRLKLNDIRDVIKSRIVANNRASNKDWPTPKPIPNDLPPVDSFALDFMPVRLAPWINDIATRLQCPPDYPAITMMTALGAVVGRKIGIKPQMKTDWLEIPNVWGAFIGPPGMLKSPAMNEALWPIHRLEAEATRNTEIARQAYAAGLDAFRLRKQVATALAREKLKKTLQGEKHIRKIDLELGKQPQEPVPVRYRTNDTTYQALAELIANNPTGILVERDELVSLLRHLDRRDQAVARGFFLTGWSGTQPYTLDRITRGTRHIAAVCISVLGNSQPARIAEYVKRVSTNEIGGDGLLQRFGLMAWPDTHPDWKDVDRNPDSRAREDAWKVFDRLSSLDTRAAIALGARRGPSDSVPFFRLSAAAHDDFLNWRSDLERRLRSGEMTPALEGHLAKYRKLVPALALINYLVDNGQDEISQQAMRKALAFSKYLETHASRLYGASSEPERTAAQAILTKVREGELQDGFTAREVHQHDWSGLTDRE